MLMDRIPPFPYACDDPKKGVYRQRKEKALARDLIQLNASNEIGSIILDIDENIVQVNCAGLPTPNLVTVNPDNRHAHLVYVLGQSVPLRLATMPQLKLLEAVQDGLKEAWPSADKGYNQRLTKNPFSDRWGAFVFRDDPYSLGEIIGILNARAKGNVSDVQKTDRIALRSDFEALGRNCKLFENLRLWAYREVCKYEDYSLFSDKVRQKAKDFNEEFNSPPLPLREVNDTVKSVSRWTWKNIKENPKRRLDTMSWSKRATARSIETRRRKQTKKMEAFEKLYIPNESYIKDVAEQLGISEKTGQRYAKALKKAKEAKEDDTPFIPGLV